MCTARYQASHSPCGGRGAEPPGGRTRSASFDREKSTSALSGVWCWSGVTAPVTGKTSPQRVLGSAQGPQDARKGQLDFSRQENNSISLSSFLLHRKGALAVPSKVFGILINDAPNHRCLSDRRLAGGAAYVYGRKAQDSCALPSVMTAYLKRTVQFGKNGRADRVTSGGTGPPWSSCAAWSRRAPTGPRTCGGSDPTRHSR